MSILKTGAFYAAACASALAFGAPASAQTKVYVKVVVGQQQQAPVYAAPQAYVARGQHAGHHAGQYAKHPGAAPCPHGGTAQSQPHYVQQYAPPAADYYAAPAVAPSNRAGVIYNRPHTSIADVQPYYEADAGYYAEPRKQSRWR